MPEMRTAPNYSVPALEKGLAVIELLARASEPLSLSQISDQMANSTSQLFRTMNCLVDSGYVIKDEVYGKYSLTLKLFELANRHSPLKHLLRVAILPMQELARTIRESCHISIIQHRQLLVVGQAESPEKVQISVSVGTSFPLVSTVSGRLLLAVMDEASRYATLQEDADYRQMSAGERELFWQRIADIQISGISSAVDESFIGLQDTAVLVGDPAVRRDGGYRYHAADGQPAMQRPASSDRRLAKLRPPDQPAGRLDRLHRAASIAGLRCS